MLISGSCLSHPFRPDVRGTLATIADPAEIVRQSIVSILSTRQGERHMLPDYGIPDFVFATMDAGFAARIKHFLEEQIRRYEPLVETIEARAGRLADGRFTPGVALDPHAAAVSIVCRVRGNNTPVNLVFPVWEMREDARRAAL